MLYDIGFAIFSIFYLPTLIFKGKLHGDFFERFGAYGKEKREALVKAKGAIWIQAVSVGEVALCRSLVPLIREKFPARPIVFSTITKTGNDLAKKLFGKDAVVIYFPLDFSFVVKKVVSLIKPKMYIMVETEIWPNFLKKIEHDTVPAILINGRISDRSFGKYELARPFLRPILKDMNILCMQSKLDAQRITSLGARPERVKVTGNMKFDVQLKVGRVSGDDLRNELGLLPGDELLVAGSTHAGEEGAIVTAFKELAVKFPKLKLLIAPRHIERTGEVETVIKEDGFVPVRLSGLGKAGDASGARRIYILDTIGRLSDFYSIATIVFVGGSLIKHGGQNPIEPAIYEKPIVFGQYMFNFKNIAEAFLAKEAAVRIDNAGELVPALYNLLADEKKRLEAGRAAKKVVVDNMGATDQVLSEMARFLDA
ncbi:MAG: 3-deoxy-D-manno-octulosonic acid transferase [Candidatus Omnitrophica bacterium]|nr:3-deoxy-D-manno-octulosonic acid transferase [Candidatus Omnitrophota bacterium]